MPLTPVRFPPFFLIILDHIAGLADVDTVQELSDILVVNARRVVNVGGCSGVCGDGLRMHAHTKERTKGGIGIRRKVSDGFMRMRMRRIRIRIRRPRVK